MWVRGTTDGTTHTVHVLLTPDNVEMLGFTPQVCVSLVSLHTTEREGEAERLRAYIESQIMLKLLG